MRGKINASAWKKLNNLKSADAGLPRALEQNLTRARDDMAQDLSRRYPEEEEIKTLVRGVARVGRFAGQEVGTASGNRLIMSTFTPMSQIIARQRVVIKSDSSGTNIRGYFGVIEDINKEARFDYARASGKVLKANPFHGMYLQSIENGGVWNVAPRRDTKTNILHPEDKVLVKAMTKEIRPKRFIDYAERKESIAIKNNLIAFIKQRCL